MDRARQMLKEGDDRERGGKGGLEDREHGIRMDGLADSLVSFWVFVAVSNSPLNTSGGEKDDLEHRS